VQPSGLPTNAVVRYFEVKGTTQSDLIQALDDDGLCTQYHCVVDPAVPAGSAAWALEFDGVAHPSAPYCYSPKTISYRFTQHVILMPRWDPIPGAVKITLVQEWNALEATLLAHEIGHVYVADQYLAVLNRQSQRQPTCQAMNTFWANQHISDGLDAAQNAYHARLRADCRPEIGCIPPGWMGW
jgi:predicted secreted Zn-dependent protease